MSMIKIIHAMNKKHAYWCIHKRAILKELTNLYPELIVTLWVSQNYFSMYVIFFYYLDFIGISDLKCQIWFWQYIKYSFLVKRWHANNIHFPIFISHKSNKIMSNLWEMCKCLSKNVKNRQDCFMKGNVFLRYKSISLLQG